MILPLSIDVQVFRGKAVLLEPALREHALRAHVVDERARSNSVQSDLAVCVCADRGDGARCQTLSQMTRVDPVTEVGTAERSKDDVRQGCDAHHLFFCSKYPAHHSPFGLLTELANNHGALVFNRVETLLATRVPARQMFAIAIISSGERVCICLDDGSKNYAGNEFNRIHPGMLSKARQLALAPHRQSRVPGDGTR
jgi:hypothetical protein